MNARKENIFSLIKESPYITQTEIMEKLNLFQGQIRRVGSNRKGYWEIL